MSDERLAALERRLRRIEDEREIERMIARYGPLVDAGDAEAVGDLWAQDGTYEVEGWSMRSRDDVAAMVRSPQHQGLIECESHAGHTAFSIYLPLEQGATAS